LLPLLWVALLSTV